MPSTSNSETKKCYYCGACLSLVSTTILLFIGLNLLVMQAFIERECILTDVTYPVTTPSLNESWSNFVECDCGRRCISDLGTCIKLFAYEKNGPLLSDGNNSYQSTMLKTHPHVIGGTYPSSECTFAEKKCRDGESHNDRLEAIANAGLKATQYVEKMNRNESIICYSSNNSDEIYLEAEYNYIPIIIGGSITFLLFVCTFVCFICYHRENEEPCFVCGIKCSECKTEV